MGKRCLIGTIVVMLCMIFIAIPSYADSTSASSDYDYVHGRPLTDEEIEKQKALEPELQTQKIISSQSELIDDNGESKSSSKLNKKTVLSSRYDLRDQAYASGIKVKNQSTSGLCWAFAMSTASEISYLKDAYESGSSLSSIQFSPLHLGYFFYNRVNDPLGNTGKDKNVITSSSSFMNVGGNNIFTIQAMANWTGMALESVAPFSTKTKSLNSSLAYEDTAVLENADLLTSSYDMKCDIMEHGAVTIDIFYNSKYLDYNTAAYYDYADTSGSNHVVTIVGWDDNYSSDNFNTTGSSVLETPSSDGAWIAQNSYGTGWGDGGYFYISYENEILLNPIAVDMESSEDYDYNYQYDGNASDLCTTVDSTDKAANVYKVVGSEDQVLKAVGMSTWNNVSRQFQIDIYTNLTSKTNPESGTKACSFTVVEDKKGYHSFKIPSDSKVLLEAGSTYSIVITAKSRSYLGVESDYSFDVIDFQAGLAKGQSFYKDTSAGTWEDVYNEDYCFRIKGFTKIASTTRIAGSDRYDTSIKVANALKEDEGVDKFDAIVVAYGGNYPDALTGDYLAAVKKAPMLLVNKTKESEQTVLNYIKSNLSDDGTVYILGGTGVVTSRFQNSVKSSYTVKRLYGSNRYSTNLAILKEAGVTGEDLLVCSGDGYADSLSASATAKPILLVGDSLSASQKAYVQSLGIDNIYIIGGTGAVKSSIEKTLSSYAMKDTIRVAGKNRFATSVAVAEEFASDDCEEIILTYGYNFPDGLSAGPLAVAENSPLVLAADSTANTPIKSYVKSAGIKEVTVLGGKSLISNDAVHSLLN